MNRPLLLVSLAFVSASASSQSARELGLYEMVRIDDSTFIDVKEVTVADMLAFSIEHPEMARPERSVIQDLPYGALFYGEQTGNTRMVKGWAKDYTRVVRTVPKDSTTSKDQRYRAERYMNYPIAGITFQQAEAYCHWRTEQYGRSDPKIVFELPTSAEYERLLSTKDTTNGQCALFNYACLPCQEQPSGKYAFIHPGSELTPVDGYAPDDKGLFNLRGNAAEMTSTPGLAKGGSYAHPARAANPDAAQQYAGPEPWLGFRCVARIRRP